MGMLQETSGCTISSVDTNINVVVNQWSDHPLCPRASSTERQKNVLFNKQPLSSALLTPQLWWMQLYNTNWAVLLLITVLQGQLALVTGISASWVGKHPSGAALMGSEGEALSSPMGRLAMVEAELEERKGDGWAMPDGARLWFPEMITLLHVRLISEPVPSFPTTRSCICYWKILHQFWLVASCSLRASFPLLHSNLIAGKEAQEKLSTNRGQGTALNLHHFSELLLTSLRSHPDLHETWLTWCSRLTEPGTVRDKGLKVLLSSREFSLVLWLGSEKQAWLVCFGCKSW